MIGQQRGVLEADGQDGQIVCAGSGQTRRIGDRTDDRADDSRRAGRAEHLKPARHFCARCMSLAYRRDHTCVHCGRTRPEGGWGELENCGDPWLGRVMQGRYLITRRMGKGASAMVYEAESLNISRQFAIKVVDLHAAANSRDPDLVRARLRREFAAISRLRNPHIVALFEVLELSEVCVGAVMDFVEGPTLNRLLTDAAPLHWRRACRILRQIANAAHAAHEAGLVHRDLKPANIMIEPMACGDEFVRVLDFGIVWTNDGAAITQGFVGTPLYASPEQARGTLIDRRSDVYSLGAILFEMLTGRPPFQSPNIMEVLRMHARNTPPTLVEAAGGRYFPPQLHRLVDRMLKKNCADRPQDLVAVIAAIDRILNTGADRAQKLRVSTQAPASAPSLAPASSAALPAERLDFTVAGHGVLESVAEEDAELLSDELIEYCDFGDLSEIGELDRVDQLDELPAPLDAIQSDGFLADAIMALNALGRPESPAC
jgi:serine/threonine protein kinase